MERNKSRVLFSNVSSVMSSLHDVLASEFIKCKKKAMFRMRNKHNSIDIRTSNWFGMDIDKISVGRESYGVINVEFYRNKEERLNIGAYCSFAAGTTFICGGNHNYRKISTYPFWSKFFCGDSEALSNGPIIVDDDVWIGYGAIIMSGVHIGQGAVVGAGALVTKDVEPYAVVVGVPAKVVRYRFSQDMISELMKIDYSKLSREQIQDNIDYLNEELVQNGQIEWLPHR